MCQDKATAQSITENLALQKCPCILGDDLSAGEAVKIYLQESICGFIMCARGNGCREGDDEYEGRGGEPGGSWGCGFKGGAKLIRNLTLRVQ